MAPRTGSRLRVQSLFPLLLLLACSGGEPQAAPYFDLVESFRSTQVESARDEQRPFALAEEELLFLPGGAQVEFLVFLRPESLLRAARFTPRGAGSHLEILLESDEAGPTPLALFEAPARDLSIPLVAEQETPVRLTLRVSGEPTEEGAGVLLEAPRLWAPAPPSIAQTSAPAQPKRPPNVIIYLVDTLRRDRLGCYGYSRPTSPRLDAFAESATLFVNAIAQSSWTKPSVASMFTGLWPPEHGATGFRRPLKDEFRTLAEMVRDAGYQTAAFVTNPNITPRFGFDQGFDHFVRELSRSDRINELAFEWLEAERDDRPLFLYVHTQDPHSGYDPPEPFRSKFAPTADQMPAWTGKRNSRRTLLWPDEALPFLEDLYDGEIAANDQSFGELLDKLQKLDLLESSLIIFTSDHGEEFKEHGQWYHGNNLHAETLNIPLLVKFPNQSSPRTVEATVQHTDLLPTILGELGLPVPPDVLGRGLADPALSSAAGPSLSRIYSHLRLNTPDFRSVIDGDWKYIEGRKDGTVTAQLFNWRDDPLESNDLASHLPIRSAVLAELVRRRSLEGGKHGPAEEVVLDEETVRELKALGYLQ